MQGINVVGVQFRRAGKIYDFASGEIECQVGDQVVVESERGPSLAVVCKIRFHHPNEKLSKKLKPILRRAGRKELDRPPRLTEERVFDFAKEKVKKLKLDMHILKGEVQFGGSKIIVYFSAPGRVDFRELVKELAGGLKSRVELKQVGARDETKLLGGLGICGREYCCSSFLREFVPVSIRMAKNQNLALNPNKVSGGCGRLLCCLTYENETYDYLRLQLPPRGAQVKILIDDGEIASVVKTDLLNQTVMVERQDGQQQTYKLLELEVIQQTKRPSRTNHQAPAPGSSADMMDQWADSLDLDALEEHVQNQKRDSNTQKKDLQAKPHSSNQKENKQSQKKPHNRNRRPPTQNRSSSDSLPQKEKRENQSDKRQNSQSKQRSRQPKKKSP